MNKSPIEILSERYPQLYLPVKNGIKNTEEYKSAVLRGEPVHGRLDFKLDPKDSLETVSTPAGEVDVLYLYQRADFEHAVRALAYRCEPEVIPASMGASHISGLINWEKIHKHMNEYAAQNETDEAEEFGRFTSEKRNFLDTLIILSSGPYSAVSAEDMKMEQDEWTRASFTIRKYHELSHFFSRTLYPENLEAIRDEIIADMIGIIAAFGSYDTLAARRFLGIEGDSYRAGGRLQNYSEGKDIDSEMSRANRIIDELSSAVAEVSSENVFDLLDYVEKNKIGTLIFRNDIV
ncbi:MAG: hypothetical protein Q4F31_02100 [Eubacteriales bacterium]|nr:hypothetical protein [Eubacteriales bacterium]